MKTRKYETLLIARPEFEKEQVTDLVNRLSERIERNKGKLLEVSDWGLRKLAYPIRLRGEKFFYGRYVLLVYAGTGLAVKEMEDYMKLIDDTFRFNSYVVSEEVPAMDQPEPIWREEVVPELKLRDDGEGLEVIEPSRQRKLSKEDLYRPKAAEKPPVATEEAEKKDETEVQTATAPEQPAPSEPQTAAPTMPAPESEKDSSKEK